MPVLVGNCILIQGQGKVERRPTGVTEGLDCPARCFYSVAPSEKIKNKTKKGESPRRLWKGQCRKENLSEED